MIVVLPLPLCPTITVTGEKNSMTDICLSSNDRIPRIASLLRQAMLTVEWKNVKEKARATETRCAANATFDDN